MRDKVINYGEYLSGKMGDIPVTDNMLHEINKRKLEELMTKLYLDIHNDSKFEKEIETLESIAGYLQMVYHRYDV